LKNTLNFFLSATLSIHTFAQNVTEKYLQVPDIQQITMRHCWVASIEMCVKYFSPKAYINQFEIIRQLSPNCDVSNCFVGYPKRKPKIYFSRNCTNCIERLPRSASGDVYDTAFENLSVMKAILSTYNLGEMAILVKKYGDNKLNFEEIIKTEINNNKPIVAYDGSNHIVVVTGYEWSNEQLYVFINDPYPVTRSRRATKKHFWKNYKAKIRYEPSGSSVNVLANRYSRKSYNLIGLMIFL
jgi:hypothetical protein